MEAERIIGRRWRIIRLIGTGGMGSVYEVEHVDIGRRYAVKQLKIELAADEIIVRGFVKEAQRLALLGERSGDPGVRHIVRIEDLETDDEFGRYIRMELIRGDNLSRHRVQHGAFSFSEVVRIGSEIAMALGLAHNNNLIHCDVKPANILIEDSTLRAVVTDFGISKRMRSGSSDETAPTTSIGGLTTRYAAPEQVRGEDIDQRTDLYALGGVLYEMASGRRFIDELKDDIPIAVKKAAAGWRPPLPFSQPVPSSFQRLLEELLENEHDKRIASAALVIDRLSECLEEFGRSTPVVDLDDVTRPIDRGPPPPPPALDEAAATIPEEDHERLTELSQELESDLELVVNLEEAARTAGLVDEGWPGLVELRSNVEEVVALGHRGRVRAALERGAAIAARLAELQREQTAALRARIEPPLADLDLQWQHLYEAAGPLLPPDTAADTANAVQAARDSFEVQQWAQTWELVQRGQQTLEAARLTAHAQTTAALRERQEQLAGAAQEWQRIDDGAPPVDVADVARQSAGLNEAGQFLAAVTAVEDATHRLQTAVAERLHAVRARVDALREAATGGWRELDEASAMQVAEPECRQARQVLADATAAEQHGEWRAAEAGYAAAAEQLAAVARRTNEWEAGQVRDGVQAVQTLLEQVTPAVEPIVAAARDAARQLLARLPARATEARPQLEAVRAQLQVRLGEAQEYTAAVAAKEVTEAAQQRVVALPVTARQQRAADRLMRAAATAFERGGWTAAREQYQQAAEAWAALERSALERAAGAKRSAQSRELDELARSSEAEARNVDALANALGEAAESGSQAQKEWKEIQQLAERGDVEAALQQARRINTELQAATHRRAEQLRTRNEERLAELRQDWADLSQRAAGLLPPDDASVVVRALDSVPQALAASDGLRAWDELSAARTALSAAAAAAQSQAQTALHESTAALKAAADYWERLGGGAPPANPHAIASQAAALLDDRQLSAAVATVAGAVDQLQHAVAERRRVLAAQVAEARAAAQARRDAVDETVAVAAAAPELDGARQAWADAERAERQENWQAAAASFHAAADAFAAVATRVAAYENEQAGQLAAEVEGLLEQTTDLAEALAGETCSAARGALVAARQNPGASRTALESARDALRSVLAQAADFAAAQGQRETAAAAQQRIAPMSLRRGDRRAAIHAMKSAATAFASRQWPTAADQYGAAVGAWAEAEKHVGKGGVPWVAIGGGGAVLAAVVAVALYLRLPSQPVSKPQSPAGQTSAPAPIPDAEKLQREKPKPVAAAPVIASMEPDPSTPVSLSENEGRSFSIKVSGDEAAADPRWLLDGTQVASKTLDWRYVPGLDAGRAEPHTLRVIVGNGDGENQLREWQIQVAEIKPPAAAAPPAQPAFELRPQPVTLASLKFLQTQKFEVTVPAGIDGKQIAYAWTVDGEKVADTPSFQFAADDPQLVRSKPVKVAVSARDASGRTFKHDWQFKVTPPPPPRIASVQPPADRPLEAQPGSVRAFELSMAPAAEGQTVSYVFSANGKEAHSATPRFELTPEAGREYTVIAYATDNFGQLSERKTWKISLPPAVEAPKPAADGDVETWLRNYRQALVKKDVTKLQDLLQLSASSVAALQSALAAQCDLDVAFNGTHVEQLAPGRYRAHYERVDKFTDCRTSQPISKSTTIEQTFRIVDGQVQLQKPQ